MGVLLVRTGEFGAPGTEVGARPELVLPDNVGELCPEMEDSRDCSFTIG